MRRGPTRRFHNRATAGSPPVRLNVIRMSTSAVVRPSYLMLFHPATGQVRVKGVTHSTNAVLHPWLQAELAAILATLPPVEPRLEPSNAAANRAAWTCWQEGLSVRFTLLEELPPLRMLLILDNLSGHKNAAFVCWLMSHGIMPLYTPLGGSWLNMAESMQRILVSRALSGQQPETPEQLITGLEATAHGWNACPTPFTCCPLHTS